MDQIQVIENSFLHFGREAVFDPEGINETILLIPAKGDEVGSFATMEVAAPGTLFEIQASKWRALGMAKPVFVIDGERRQVQGTPKAKDSRRLVLILDSQKVTTP
ncbi:head-tail joining protein [Thalassovita sp.]|uniref:head-tail joining protein n=1 Tax=Thalassovita sp. TaxID=1979401 RepID=UPI002AB0113E|nr:hypothetical protein [Thalassovita sp.]